MNYLLTYAGVPFITDFARVVRMHQPAPEQEDPDQLPPRRQQPLADLIDELDRLQSLLYLQDFRAAGDFPGRNIDSIARLDRNGPVPNPEIKIGDWYYPNTASRWSVFRGLATSAQARAMLKATGGIAPKPFVMRVFPDAPGVAPGDSARYTVSTGMYMLPARPLAEHGAGYDGLYLVTLVDDRWYFQGNPADLQVTKDSTWDDLLFQLAAVLGITLISSAVPAAYGRPEPDSQLWEAAESACLLLDAVAFNLGRVIARNLDGTYEMLTPAESLARTAANRRYARFAGGDLFLPAGTRLAAGDLTLAKNAVVPASVNVAFPKYVAGDDPVPHFVNPRTLPPQRPSAWYEDSHAELWYESVPIVSGGPFASGLFGVGQVTFLSTAKALLSGEAQSTPLNRSGLTALALQIADDFYGSQAAAALDETYPGTFALAPEGLHDVVWTWSERARKGTTRVLRTEWNQAVREFQHAAPALSGSTGVPKGVGGKSVAQTWRDSALQSGHASGTISTQLNATLASGDSVVALASVNNLPTDNRWRGKIDNEVILFEGTSGLTNVRVAFRGVDGTVQGPHNNLTTVTWLLPNVTYGVNLVTHGQGQFVFPAEWTSGGVQGTVVVPQVQTVQALAASGQLIRDTVHYSGSVCVPDMTRGSGGLFPASGGLCWVVDRNAGGLASGRYYGAQFVGYSASGPVAPVYLVSDFSLGAAGFPAMITGHAGQYHSFKEQTASNNNLGWEDKPGGREGMASTAASRAREYNTTWHVPIGTVVRMYEDAPGVFRFPYEYEEIRATITVILGGGNYLALETPYGGTSSDSPRTLFATERNGFDQIPVGKIIYCKNWGAGNPSPSPTYVEFDYEDFFPAPSAGGGDGDPLTSGPRIRIDCNSGYLRIYCNGNWWYYCPCSGYTVPNPNPYPCSGSIVSGHYVASGGPCSGMGPVPPSSGFSGPGPSPGPSPTPPPGGGGGAGSSGLCCETPAGAGITFVDADIFPPQGISTTLVVRLLATQACSEKHCAEGTLVWDGGKWVGTVSGVTVTMLYVAGVLRIQAQCGGPLIDGVAVVNCRYPFQADMDIEVPDCCLCPDNRLTVHVYGYCYPAGTVSTTADPACCKPACPPLVQNCCQLYDQCTVYASIESLDPACVCLDNAIVPMPCFPPPDHSHWMSDFVVSCDRTWQLEATCLVDGVGKRFVRLSVIAIDADCPCSGSADVYFPDPCYPLSLVYDIQVVCNPFAEHVGQSCGPHLRITLTL